MNWLKRILASVLTYYGRAAAGRPSYHGAFECRVPECLQKKVTGHGNRH